MNTQKTLLAQQALEQKIAQIKARDKIFSNQDLYSWVQWHYGKGRWWTDKYIRPNLRWRQLKTKGYKAEVIGKYLPLEELKRELRSILNDYSG